MKIKEYNILMKHLIKNKNILIGILSLISLFEIVLIIRGLIFFDFTKINNIFYMISYFIILFVSLGGLFILFLRFFRKKENINIFLFAVIYVSVLFIFSLIISILDISNGLPPIVFLTITIAIPFFCQIDPFYYSVLTLLGTISLIICNYVVDSQYFIAGFTINMVVYESIAIFATFKNYNFICSEYLMLEKLESLSNTDQLTNVNNRRALDERINQIVEHKIKTTIIMADMNNFKKINDTYGHNRGDECLQYLSERMKMAFDNDGIYRYGGDEFAVITTKEISEIIMKITEINLSLNVKFMEFELSISAGIYEIQQNDTVFDIFNNVDNALYQAKREIKNKIIVYNQ